MLEFNREMLIPTINGEVYYSIYEIENWIRRICLTTYIIEFGSGWYEKIPKKVISNLKYQSNKNSEIKYLGAEDDKNFIWSATLGEVVILLEDEKVKLRLEEIIGCNKERFITKINELREVRNLLAHNRALSPSSEIIIRGIVESLRLSIKNFKNTIIYNNYSISLNNDNDEIEQYFNNKMEGNDWSQFQAFISKNDNLYCIVCLPAGDFCKYPSAAKLLRQYESFNEDVLAFLLNKGCDEFSVIVSKKVDSTKIKKIIDIFLEQHDIWTNKAFEEQNPKYSCNPKMWFYENNIEIEE